MSQVWSCRWSSRQSLILLVVAAVVFLLPAAGTGQARGGRRDDPGGRARWFLQGRRSPDHEPAAAHMRRAMSQRQSVLFAPGRAPGAVAVAPSLIGFRPSGSGTWQELGPLPLATTNNNGDVSGRVTAIAIDPSDTTGNTVYVGAAFGGVWKSGNALGGSPTFVPLTDAAVTLAVGAIAVDGSTSPSTILVGTGEPNNSEDSYYGEGLLESSDGGKTWTQVTSADGGATSFIGDGFSRILFDAADPKIVLAAVSNHTTGDPQAPSAAGIYRSTDHGATWRTAFNVPSQDGSVTDLVYDPGSKSYYAAVDGVGIYKSSDQGSTWKQVTSPLFGSPAGTPIAQTALAVRSGTLYALMAGSDGKPLMPTPCTAANSPHCDTGLAQSSDGGVTWSPIPMPDTSTAPPDVSFSNLYCEGAGATQSCQGYYDIDIAAPASGGLVVGGLDLWGTGAIPAMNSTGISTAWTDLTNAYSSAIPNTVHTDQHAIALYSATTWFVGSDGGLWATTDGGASWENLNATLGNIQFQSVSPDQSAPGVWIGGSQDNGTMKLTGPGLEWTEFQGGDGGYTATNPDSPLQYFTEFNGIGVQRFDQAGAGKSVDVVDSNVITDTDFDFYVPFLVMPPPNSTFLMLGTCSVWGGPDDDSGFPFAGAGGWYTFSSELDGCTQGDYIVGLAASASDSDVAWAVTSGGTAWMTDDLTVATSASPADWLDATSNLPSSNSTPFSTVAINPINPQIVYVGVQGFGSGHVFKTVDGGVTWADITGNLPDAPINWILIDPQGPNNDIYVASDVGVFAATDGGVADENWEQVGGGLPDTPVFQLALSPSNWTSRALAAATHGRGMWAITPLPTPDFTLAASPAAQTVLTGAGTTFTVTATGENGEDGPISYQCTAPATGCTVSPASALPGAAVTVTLAKGTLASGNNTVTISAANEVKLTHTISATITGTGFSISASPSAPTVLAGSPASFSVVTQAAAGFSGSIALACTTPATGCTVLPASVTAGGSAQVTVAAAQLPVGNQGVTVTATGGGTTETLSTTVAVQGFTLSATAKTATVLAGSGALFTVAVNGQNGFSGPVALACTQPASGCSFSPASVVAGGTSTLTVSSLAVGNDTVTITGTDQSASASASGSIAVQGFTLSATAQAATVLAGSGALFTVAVNGQNGFSGQVALACTQPASGCSFDPASVAAGGTSTLTVNGLAAGNDTVTITGTDQTASGSASGSIVVQDFSLAATTPAATAHPGQNATYDLMLTSEAGFSGTVALSCSGAPAKATCAIAPASVTPTSSGAAATVTVTTLASGATPPQGGPGGGGVWLWFAALGCGALGWGLRRRRPNRRLQPALARAVLWTALASATLLASACGGGGSATPPPPSPAASGTPVGTYTLTVTGTSGGISHSSALTLTVQ